MSPNDPTKVQITGRPGHCTTCRAPWCEPIPSHFPVTVSGPMADAVVTIHLSSCRTLGAPRWIASAEERR